MYVRDQVDSVGPSTSYTWETRPQSTVSGRVHCVGLRGRRAQHDCVGARKSHGDSRYDVIAGASRPYNSVYDVYV